MKFGIFFFFGLDIFREADMESIDFGNYNAYSKFRFFSFIRFSVLVSNTHT